MRVTLHRQCFITCSLYYIVILSDTASFDQNTGDASLNFCQSLNQVWGLMP